MTHPDLDNLEADDVLETVLGIYSREFTSCRDGDYTNKQSHVSAIRAVVTHLAAQRQGGDAGGMPERIWINDEYLPGCYQKRPAWPGSGKDVQYIRADLAHPPAVTGDRGALDAVDVVFGYIARTTINGKLHPELFNAAQTIRTAILSAQAGVPGDVVEKVKNMAKQATVAEMQLKSVESEGDFEYAYDCMVTEARQILALLSPYLNTNEGRD